MRAYYAARAPEYDDWYLRRGRYSRGPARDLCLAHGAGQRDRWLDAQPLRAAGSWSSRRAPAGGRRCSPARASCRCTTSTPSRSTGPASASWRTACVPISMSATRGRSPTRQVDGVFCGFWLSHVTDERLPDFLALVRRWLRPGRPVRLHRLAARPGVRARGRRPVPVDGVSRRRLADGRTFRVVKVHRTPEALGGAGAGRVRRGGRHRDAALLRDGERGHIRADARPRRGSPCALEVRVEGLSRLSPGRLGS